MKKIFPKTILYFSIMILIIANIFNLGADIAIMAASTKLVLGLNVNFWAIAITITIILMEVFIPYHFYSKILNFLSFILVSYIITTLIIPQNWSEIIKFTFIPHFKFTKEFILIATGFIGTTISPYLFFWQTSQEIEDGVDHNENHSSKNIKKLIRKTRIDTFIGMTFSQVIAFFIVITCFSVLHKNGIIEINSAYDAAIALKPLAGDCAFLLFTLGIIGSGLLGVPVLAGSAAYALSEIFKQKESLAYKYNEAKFFYGVIIFSTLIGLIINFIGINPIKALLYAAIINCIAASPLVLFTIIIANKKEIMGKHKNGLFSNIAGIITFSVMFLSAILVFTFM